MRLLMSCALLLAGLVGSTVSAAPPDEAGGAKAAAARGNRIYVVRMVDRPVVAYDGGVTGYAATRPARGAKIDVRNPNVVKYAAYLDARHDAAVARAGGRKVYDYRFSFNGFAAELTPAQADALRADPAVLSVDKDALVDADTSTTPAFLDLAASGGLWAQAGGPGAAGEGIVIGVVDSGIWPEHPSFSDRTGLNGNATRDAKLAYQQLPAWNGRCVPGQAFTASSCNQKLIAAQHFNAGWGGDAGVAAALPWEFRSARDYNGHGTHTASTAGGNGGVAPTGPTAALGAISGVAPRARIAAYKALWHQQATATASGFTSDLVAAIDQAVADGVDVINYSVSGSRTNFRDPVEIAFLFAADAGVFVATSAGNSGPTTSTVAHPGPWVTTVAAGTHDRDGVGSVTMGGVTYPGASFATPASAPIVDATAAGLAGADPEAVRLCFSTAQNGGAPALDPAKVAGKIVVCDRGVSARIDKSLAVQEAGGVGVVLVNVTPNSVNADVHFLPTVHLQSDHRAAVKAYAATAGATASIAQSTVVRNVPAPATASFSSRGPLLAGGGDLLKPDVIAPGQDIHAGVAPPNNFGRLFDVYSGTSMSSPHVAGLAAVFKQLHPGWSPMAIKSALMTSARDVIDSTTTATRIFRQGAGHVVPTRATDPGLVYDSSAVDWFGFLCGTQLPASFCEASGIPVLDPSDLNGASIAIGDLPGTQTVTRRVTNVGPGTSTYTAAVSGIGGVEAVVTPSTLTLAPGESASFTVAFRRTAANLNVFTGGALTWTDGVHTVRSPIVVRPVALAAPAEVSGSYAVKFGYDGAFSATPRGLVPATTFDGAVATDPDGTFAPEVAAHTAAFTVTIPAGTTLARLALFDANTTAGSDLDLFVHNANGAQVGASAGGTSQETVTLVNPPAGDYTVYVHGFATAGPSSFTLFAWDVGGTAAGNLTVTAPTTATTGASATITLDTAGLTPGVKYLGTVAYGGAAGMPAPTIVTVSP